MEKTSELELEGGSSKIPIVDLIACVDRELGYRQRVYPRWVAARKMSQDKADVEILRMEMVRSQLFLVPDMVAQAIDLKAQVHELTDANDILEDEKTDLEARVESLERAHPNEMG